MPKPLHLRQLKAEMALKELSLGKLAEIAGVPYATASELLNGYRLDPVRLTLLASKIKSYQIPMEAAAK